MVRAVRGVMVCGRSVGGMVATSGCCTWRQLSPVFGSAWPTIYRRFAQWSRDRVWARLHWVTFDELGARGELD